MGDWEYLPVEILSYIFSFLPRRDLLACSLTCDRWKYALDHSKLWRSMVIHIDTDLMEPSTTFLVRDYCKYIKNLEFGWAIPHRYNKWSQFKYKELTKRAVRFFIILHDGGTQIERFRIFNWFDFMCFQKVAYHIARFLKNQQNLKSLVFENININSSNCTRVFCNCLRSRNTINYLDIRHCYCCLPHFDGIYFRSCIEQLTYLKTFKLDFLIFSCKVIDSLLTSNNKCLENLEIIIKETSWSDKIVEDQEWIMLCSACPNLKVTLIIRNVYRFNELKIYLKQSIPIVTLSIVLPRVMDRGGRYQFRKTINLIVNNYYKTLVNVDFHVRNEDEVLDDGLLTLIRRCTKLKTFVFNGLMENPQKLKSTFRDITFICIVPNSMPGRHIVFDKVYREDIPELRHKRVQFSVIKREMKTQSTLMILN